MADWYWIGVCVGIAAAAAVVGTAAVPSAKLRIFVGTALGTLVGVFVGLQFHWYEAVGGIVGAATGLVGAYPLVAGAGRRGGTYLGTAVLVVVAAVVIAGLAFVPVLGYVEAVALLVLGLRLRRRRGDRYAGLRTLARD